MIHDKLRFVRHKRCIMMSLLCQPLLLLIACAVVSYDSLFSPSGNKSPHSVLAVVCVRCHDKALQVALVSVGFAELKLVA
jgi:hypothetical protein